MTEFLEDEAKLSFPEGAELPSFDAGRRTAAAAPPVVMRSVYYDAPDLRLAAAGITLRRRTQPGTSSWDLKVPVLPGEIGVRREISVDGRPAKPPAAHADVLAGWLGGDPLGPVATLRTRRTTWTVGDGEAEIVDDEVEALDGRAVVSRFREVEIERRGVPESYVRTVARRLAKAGATPVEVTKLARVVGVPEVPPLPDVTKRSPVSALLVRGLRTAGADLLAADIGVRLGDEDAIHQLRVACRRMRSLLRAYGDVLDDEWRTHLDGELRWVGQALGAARDAEVIAARIAADGADEAVLADVVARRTATAEAAKVALHEPRYLDLARHVRCHLASQPLKDAGKPAGDVAARVVGKAWRDLERSVRRLRRDHDDAAWHAVRIAAKRARYAAETARAVDPGARKVARAAEAVQDVLGEWHDAVMARATLLECAALHPGDGAYGLAAGQLAERERRAAEDAQARLPKVWARHR